ncbi:MAG TPA: glycosyltransferase family 39 protein, partial [bacterium]|nr:glycosyltransferase family 39 protein [bacterium]
MKRGSRYTLNRFIDTYPITMASLIVITGFVIRVIRIGNTSFWSDEVDTLYAGMHHIYFHPPFFLILARAWAAVASSDAMLRVLSALFSTGGIAAAWFLGRRVTRSKHIAFWASVLVALNPGQVYYGREFRMYSLLALLTAVSWIFFFKWLNDGGFRWAAALILIGTAILYTHHYGVIFLASQGLTAIFLKPRKTAITKLGVYTGVMVLVYIPYIRQVIYLSSRMLRSNYWAYPITLKTPFYLMRAFVPHFEVPLPAAAAAVVVAIFLLFIALRSRPPYEWRYLVLFGFLVPVMIAVLISRVLPTSALVARYLIFTSIPLCVGLAAGVNHVIHRWSGRLLTAVLVSVQLWSISLQYSNTFLFMACAANRAEV